MEKSRGLAREKEDLKKLKRDLNEKAAEMGV